MRDSSVQHFFANPPVEFPVSAVIHEYKSDNGTSFFMLEYGIGVKSKSYRQTLYNCKLEIKYLAINGTWLKIVQSLGTLDFSYYKNGTIPMPGFKLDPNRFHAGNLWPVDTQNIELKAYGYLKP